MDSARVEMAVTVKTPRSWGRWRWMLCFWLIKLAARVYPFKLQFYREEEWYEDRLS